MAFWMGEEDVYTEHGGHLSQGGKGEEGPSNGHRGVIFLHTCTSLVRAERRGEWSAEYPSVWVRTR